LCFTEVSGAPFPGKNENDTDKSDGEWIYSIIDDKLFLKSPCWDSPSMQRDLLQQIDREDVENVYRKTYQTGSKALFFAQCKDQNETWVPLIQKAYAKAHGDYASLSGGWIGEGLEDLSGGVTTELLASDILDLDGFWDLELSKVNEEFLFGCSTGLLDGGYGDRDGIEEGHAYVVMEARKLKNGTRLVKLRNPWGQTKKGIWEGAWSDGSKEWTAEAQEEVGHQFGSDSVFWISYEDLLRKYQHFDRTRLFRDPDWRCCQRWIGVDVAWKPQYHEKFHIKLTREGPLVIVLSQLDNRYFKGLHGQYSFRLQFRIHEQDRPDAEDYIVRSHGNYLMDRSVSIELPSMLPGTYSVFISVAGERNTDVSSIEEVVKRECKKRTENEKLAQVGYAYDLAHSKAAAHLDAVKKARKRADQKKASGARQTERHRLWEKRHLNRQITKKQGRKNNQKLEAKQAARDDKKRLEEERKPKDQGVQTEDVEEKPADTKAEATPSETPKVEDKVGTGEAKVEPKADSQADDDSSPDATPIATPLETPLETPTMEKVAQLPVKTDAETADKDEPKDDQPKDADAKDKAEDTSEAKSDKENTEKADASGSDSSGSPSPTPKSDASSPSTDGKDKDKVPVPPAKVSGAPPPAPPVKPSPPPPPAKKSPNMYVTSDGESSASPIDDWEELYSSDDMSRKPRMAAPPPPSNAVASKYRDDTEDENEPEPWNAICVVGLRVYSKDEDLELRVVIEGGELGEGGMGEKGGVDLDNAQANAGGARTARIEKRDDDDGDAYEGDSEVENKKTKKGKKDRSDADAEADKDKADDGLAPYPVIVQRGKGDDEYETAVESMLD
jgi:hypothetical protein